MSDAASMSEELLKAVRAGRMGETARLLDGMTDAERRACLPALKDLRKELRTADWNAASRRAYPVLHAAGAVCHTGPAGAAAWLTAADLRWSQAPSGILLHMLGDRERAWLGDVVHRLAARPQSAQVPYDLMSGLVRLSGCPVPTTETYVTGWVEHVSSLWPYGDTLAQRLRQDPYTTRLVAAVFDVPEVGSRLGWFGDGPNSWYDALPQLTREGVLDRKATVDACVGRLVRGGTPGGCRVFLRLLTKLELTREEEREHVAAWLAMASDGLSTVASHAQSVLGALALDGALTPRQLAEMSGGVVFRAEKKLVRAQLVLLGKALRRDPASAAELLPAVARAFGHEDTDVQERALRLVERHAGAVSAEVRGEVADEVGQLSPGLRVRATRLLGVDAAGSAPEPYLESLPPVSEPARVAPAADSAVELAEEVGALLASGGDVAAFERALDGLVRHGHRDREALAEALKPVAAGRWWLDAGPQYTSVDEYFRADPHGLEVVLATVLGRVGMAPLHKAVQHGPVSDLCEHSALSAVLNARLWEAAHRLRTDPLPFLLATPTWGSGLLDPQELVARLDTYHRLGVRPGEADFAQALLRVRRDDCATVSAAAERARALGTTEGERLARWLTADGPALPVAGRRTSGARILLGLDPLELDGFQGYLPEAFRRLGRPVGVFEARSYCPHYWHRADRQHWLAVVPGLREMVAARLLRELSAVAVEGTRGGAFVLPLIAEAEGEPGQAVRLCVAYGLGARHSEDRLSAVDALLVLAARGQLDAEGLGADLGQLVRRGAVKPLRLAESVRSAATTGAYATVWAVLRAALPVLLADLATDAPAPSARGFAELLAVAAECAERTGARGELAHLGQTADRRGSSRLVTQARRLRATLDQPMAA